jgi:hypothetical protein
MNTRFEQARAECAHIQVLSLDAMRALPGAQEYDSGIYFLWEGERLLYIGKSRNLSVREYYQSRLRRYAPFQTSDRAKPVPYDRMTCLVLESGIECSRELDTNLRNYERAYIAAYETPYNEDYQQNGFT